MATYNANNIFGLDKPYGVQVDNVNFDAKPKFTLRANLPKPNGGNRLTESMVPGYTGYIPSRKFHFSDTYRAECDQCIDDFAAKKSEKAVKTNDLINNHVKAYARHTQIATSGEVKNVLDNFRDSTTSASASLKCITN